MRSRVSSDGRPVRRIALHCSAPSFCDPARPADRFSRPGRTALDAGAFEAEIAPISLPPKKRGGEPVSFKQDEHPRPQATVESLAKLPPVFAKNGAVTAGNASGICDGAAANVVVSEEAVKRYGLKPLAKVVAYHVNAVEPTVMGQCSVLALRHGLSTELTCTTVLRRQVSVPSRESAEF